MNSPSGADCGDRVGAIRVMARLHRMLESVDSGLTVPQYRVLAAIAQGGVRSAHLAERLAVRRPTLTALADGLVAAGYACRESEAGDRRVVRLHATDQGRAALVRADEAYLARFDRLLEEIPNPQRLIADLLTVGAALDARLQAAVSVESATVSGSLGLAAEPATEPHLAAEHLAAESDPTAESDPEAAPDRTAESDRTAASDRTAESDPAAPDPEAGPTFSNDSHRPDPHASIPQTEAAL